MNVSHSFSIQTNILIETQDDKGNPVFNIDMYGEYCRIAGRHVAYQCTEDEGKPNVTGWEVRTMSEPILRWKLYDIYHSFIPLMKKLSLDAMREIMKSPPGGMPVDLPPITMLAAKTYVP